MLRVTVRIDAPHTQPLDAEIIPMPRIAGKEIIINDQLKVFHCNEASKVFNGLNFDEQVRFSINRAEFENYYYQAKDDAGFIFQSNP